MNVDFSSAELVYVKDCSYGDFGILFGCGQPKYALIVALPQGHQFSHGALVLNSPTKDMRILELLIDSALLDCNFLKLPEAKLRPVFDGLQVSIDRSPNGPSLLHNDGKFFLRAAGNLRRIVIDIKSGEFKSPNDALPTVAFAQWEVGQYTPQGFQAYFSVDASAPLAENP